MYRIKQREFSSNVIERGILQDNGKVKWEVYIAPTTQKSEGDEVCKDIYKILKERYNLMQLSKLEVKKGTR